MPPLSFVPAPVHAVVGASDDGMELSLVEGEGRAVACGGGGLEAGCWGPGVEIACCGGYTDAVGGISI
ncbi:hypothetical protein DID88_010341 [Monilinia fructigena]|uniref:Uncharacterized protein n=1 Tax=Monilinia fructigena TaxID=38457 RepID=A0A395ILM5_9HELO|nr:hypothetical protein DID88_010341 [Monilinia fructigena]